MAENDPSQNRRSRLSQAQQRAVVVIVSLSIFMLADTLYLLTNRIADALRLQYFAVTETSLPKLYQVMVLSHTAVGLALAIAASAFVLWHLPVVWRAHRRRAISTGVGTISFGLVLTVTGLFILSDANSRENAWAFWSHVGAAALLPACYLAHRRLSIWKPSRRSYRVVPVAVLGLTLIVVALHGLTYDSEQFTAEAQQAFAEGAHEGPGSKQRNVADFALTEYVPANFVPVESPFFPAATTTTTGSYLPSRIITRGDISQPEKLEADLERHGFVVDELIGAETCARCHADIVDQWSTSAHRFASFNNPFYEATINSMRETATAGNAEVDAHIAYFSEGERTSDLEGREAFVKSKWCSGCHDPALMLAGKMTEPIARRSAQAQAGLTCLACHAIDQIHNVTGNGNYNIADEQEDPYLFANSRAGTGRFIHDTAIKSRPAVHKRQMLKPFFRTSEFCATCHKVSLDSRVNNYRWLRGQDEYDNWHDSGVAVNASRTFYLPAARRLCQDCHMPPEEAHLGDVAAKNGKVRSHRFVAVNTALPFLRGDTETIERIESFLQDEKLRVDLFSVKGDAGIVHAPIDGEVVVTPGEYVEFDVVVRNKGVGHTFPGGTNDSNEGWLEVSVRGSNGDPIAISGTIQPDGYVDPAAHFYKALMVDNQGVAVHKRNAQDIFAPVYVRVIGPGTADVAHYGFTVPAQVDGDRLSVTARLMWRKFDRAYTEFAFNTNRPGFAAFDEVPDLPVTEIARAELLVSVKRGDHLAKVATGVESAEWVRFNDYGIGLLLQSDTRGAMAAFNVVSRLVPQRLDGWLNMAKTALRDGDLDGAYEYLTRCEEVSPGDGQVAWVWGVAHQKNGQYEEAETAYRHVLTQFPDDRASWRNLGRVLYLDGRFDESLEAMERTLAIDPEDRSAHYHRMLALRGLGRKEEAAAAEALYQYYQIDESAQEVTRAYRLNHEQDNLEAQAIHIHKLGGSVVESGKDT